MPTPLPEGRHIGDPFSAAPNLGLVWNKFFDGWDEEFSDPPGGPNKQGWIDRFSKQTGNRDDLERSSERRKKQLKYLGGSCGAFTTTAPFVTGMGLEHPVENGFAFHHTLGVPYLPASSVKGLVRAWAEHWRGVEEYERDRIFGSAADAGGVGSVIVFDALPEAPVTLMAEVLTPHDGGWRQGNASAPSDWLTPLPIPFLAVAPGARFLFAMAPRPGARTDDVETAMSWLREALDWVGAGAKTAVGFGRFPDDSALDEPAKENEARARADQRRLQRQERNAPPSVGDTMRHEEWGRVEVRAIAGDMATVYSLDEADEVTLPLSELTRP